MERFSIPIRNYRSADRDDRPYRVSAHSCQPKHRLFPFRQFEPRKRPWGTFVRQAGRAGIEKAGPLHFLVSRHVGMAVEQELRAGRGVRRRDVDEMEPMAEPLQLQAHRPFGLVVLIPPHHKKLRTQLPDRLERRLFADIAEMPDLIRLADGFEQGRDETVVRVRDDGDAK